MFQQGYGWRGLHTGPGGAQSSGPHLRYRHVPRLPDPPETVGGSPIVKEDTGQSGLCRSLMVIVNKHTQAKSYKKK